MVPIVKRRTLLIVPLLVLALAAPAHAAGFAGAESFWSWLLRWVAATSLADKGPAIDPLGGGIGSATGQGDVGPQIDPNGRNGIPPTTGQGDEGPDIDPLGGGNGD